MLWPVRSPGSDGDGCVVGESITIMRKGEEEETVLGKVLHFEGWFFLDTHTRARERERQWLEIASCYEMRKSKSHMLSDDLTVLEVWGNHRDCRGLAR